MLPNFEERLVREVGVLAQSSMRIRVAEIPEGGKFLPWIGGSILASLSAFQKMWVTKQEYDESGPSVAHRKCT